MGNYIRHFQAILILAFAAAGPAIAADGHVLDQDAEAALKSLYSTAPGAKAIGENANDQGRIVITTAFRPGVRLAIPGSDARISLPLMISIEDNGQGVPEHLKPDAARVKHQVEVGGASMPSFKGTLSDVEIANVAAYVASAAGK